MRFCGQKDSMQRIFIQKYFLFTMGSVCRVKRFTTEWQRFRWWRRGWNGGAEVAETTVKRLLCCGFRRTGKATGQVYQCLWRICREINVFFPGSNTTCFTFYIHLWPIYWLSLASYAAGKTADCTSHMAYSLTLTDCYLSVCCLFMYFRIYPRGWLKL
jgi:hypothetical protein